MTYQFTQKEKQMLSINTEFARIQARKGAIHRINYAIHSPVRADRCANRATNLLTALSLSHPDDPIALAAIDKALGKLERRPHLLFNFDKKNALRHRIYTCMYMLKQISLHNLQDDPIGQIIEKHLTRALIARARTRFITKGNAAISLDILLNPEPQNSHTPNAKADLTRPDQYMVSHYERLKPATERMVMALLNALTNREDILRARLYLTQDAAHIVRINHPNLQSKVKQWLGGNINIWRTAAQDRKEMMAHAKAAAKVNAERQAQKQPQPKPQPQGQPQAQPQMKPQPQNRPTARLSA